MIRVKKEYDNEVDEAIGNCIDNLKSWKAFSSLQETLSGLENDSFNALVKRMIEMEMLSQQLSREDIMFTNGNCLYEERDIVKMKCNEPGFSTDLLFSDIHLKESAEAIRLAIRGMVRKKIAEGNESIQKIKVIDYENLREIFHEILMSAKVGKESEIYEVNPLMSYLEDVWFLRHVYRSSFLLGCSYEEPVILEKLFDTMLSSVDNEVKKDLAKSVYGNAHVLPKKYVICLQDIVFNKRMKSDNDEWANHFVKLLVEVYHEDNDKGRKENFIKRVINDYRNRYVSVATERERNKEFINEMLAQIIDFKELNDNMIRVKKEGSKVEIEWDIKSLMTVVGLYKIGVFNKIKNILDCSYLAELDDNKVMKLELLLNQDISRNNDNIKEMLCVHTLADRLGRVIHELSPEVKVEVVDTVCESNNGLKKYKVVLDTEGNQEIDNILDKFLKVVVGNCGSHADDFTEAMIPYLDDYLMLKEVREAKALKEVNIKSGVKRKF